MGLGDVDPSGPILIAGLILGLLVVAGWWWLKASELEDLAEKITRAEREVEELRPIIEEVEAFKAKQAELEQKITVIQDLKDKQRGPVEIMDRVSRALPDLLWLEQLEVRGTSVDIRGEAMNTNAIAAFIENLDKVPEFQEPDTREISRTGASYRFQLSFTFNLEPPSQEGEEDEAEVS